MHPTNCCPLRPLSTAGPTEPWQDADLDTSFSRHPREQRTAQRRACKKPKKQGATVSTLSSGG